MSVFSICAISLYLMPWPNHTQASDAGAFEKKTALDHFENLSDERPYKPYSFQICANPVNLSNLGAFPPTDTLRRYEFTHPQMGTTFRLVF